ncbi:hypothetical protein ABEB36_010374 [Hypothenemus hampei]|uniref:Carboxylic ester hydrolase n=1 Tax=Hypothenemus hampei TaxID=57062 RepID=A0ABD1EJH3_HYPHA
MSQAMVIIALAIYIYYIPANKMNICLYINVYLPNNASSDALPVMFWIYGGGFEEGNAEKALYGPDYLIEHDVIVVTFNYRLGPFAFLSTGDEILPGNLGLKDQNLALNWTHKNIKYFGGDPEKITIFGESAGGASTGLHLISKRSAGLFRAAIAQSGSALTYWSVELNPRPTAFALADNIGGGNYGNDSAELKKFLKARTTKEIALARSKLSNTATLFPVLEIENENAFLTESPYSLLESGDFNQVPLIIGICAEESLWFLKNVTYAKYVAYLVDTLSDRLIPTDLRPNSSDINSVEKDIKNIYLEKDETFSTNILAFANVSWPKYYYILKSFTVTNVF